MLGQVERVTFENEETGFRVIRLGGISGLDGQTRITAVGVMQAVGQGSQVRVTGHVETDTGSTLGEGDLVLSYPALENRGRGEVLRGTQCRGRRTRNYLAERL